MVVVEDLQLSNMSRSAAGSIEQPGRNVRAKSGLNRSTLDQGWAGFRRQLEYKMLLAGGLLLAVPPMNTSRTCPRCGHVSADNRRRQAEFACVACGFHENADLVGAINVLRAGHARLACEVNGEVSRQQQEPSEKSGLAALVGIPFVAAQAATTGRGRGGCQTIRVSIQLQVV
jgi:putative transposase